MTQAQLPDGRILNFPDDTPFEVIQSTVQRVLGLSQEGAPEAQRDGQQTSLPPATSFPPKGPGAARRRVAGGEADTADTPDDPDIFDRLSDRLAQRGVDFQEILAAQEAGEQNFGLTAAQIIGKVGAGAAVDIVGEVINTTAQTAFDIIENVAPETTQDIVDGFEALMGTDAAKGAGAAIGRGIEAYQAWASENPVASRTLDAVANLAIIFSPVKIKPGVPSAPGIVGRAGQRVEARGVSQAAEQRTTFLEGLIRPKETPTVRAEAARRTADPTAFTPGRVTATPLEAEIARTVGDIPTILPGNSLRQNLRIIDESIGQEAIALQNALKAEPFKISREAIVAERAALDRRLTANPLLIGDAKKIAEKVLAQAAQLISRNPKTGAGMLAARRQLDAWVKRQRPKVFDPKTENALSVAVREVRDSMNNLLDDAAPSAGVRQSLRRQSNLFRASENIADKAAFEVGSKAQRAFETIQNALGLRGIGIGIMGILGIGTGPVAATAASLFTVGAAGKVLLSPQAKKALSRLLQLSDRAIRTTKDARVLKTLRADRIALIELTREFNNKKNEDE